MEPKTLRVNSVSEFVETVGKFEQRHVAQWFYRGHADSSYKLIPGLFRIQDKSSFSTWEDTEEYLLTSFKSEATPYLINPPENEMDWLVLAQHHGLPTRFLDWTTNPLIGLYFAVEAFADRDADLWCIGFPSTNNCLAESTHFARRFHMKKGGFVYYPKHLSPRVTNQSGCFTVHNSPVPLDEIEELTEFLTFARIQIASARKACILDELYNLGIHRGLIYPGLDGIAKKLVYELTAKNYRHTNEPEL